MRSGVQNPLSEEMLEIKGFLCEQLLLRTANPLEWWISRALVYKNMWEVMKTGLCIVATSVPSEQIFSNTGQVIIGMRNRLSPGKLCELNPEWQFVKRLHFEGSGSSFILYIVILF